MKGENFMIKGGFLLISGLFDELEKEEQIHIETIDDIYKYSDKLIDTVLRHMN
ncbi:hypothetical protein [uncultured Carboxylicivirga sp.]|uniref:hypothetical protein n=1 Tax=uncultured Carboxylicivirga sp. TaxID=1628156 RepID=UPI002599288D|nr:hypothetical protein [uncultured Carboxylicivirga sp.]